MTGKRDVSDEIELKNGRALPGWSTYEVWHDGKEIGSIYCGFMKIADDGYFHTEEKEGNLTRVKIWKKEIELKVPR